MKIFWLMTLMDIDIFILRGKEPSVTQIISDFMGLVLMRDIFSGEDVLPVRYKYNFGTEERRDDDTSLYNGGALSNRKEKYISVSATKTWKAAYYQDDLSNVEVELTLEAKHKNPNPQSYGESDHYEKDDWYKVKDNEGKEVKLLLSGFDAYHLSRTGSVDVNEYCENGHLLEFRWVETKIYETVEGQSEKKEIEPYTIEGETRSADG